MTDQNNADITAADDSQIDGQVLGAAETEVDVELTPEQLADKAAEENDKKQADESRTQKRRRQRNARELRIAKEEKVKAEIDAAYWRGKAESGHADQPANKEPQQDDFDTFDEYVNARVDWKLEQGNALEKKPKEPARKPESEENQNGRPSTEFASFTAAGEEKYGNDWADMLDAAKNNEFVASETMVNVMIAESNGVDIAMHLYDNPNEAERIAQLSPIKQLKELTKLSDNIGNTADKSLSKKISGAPRPVSSSRSSSFNEGGLHNLSMDDYVAKRLRQKQSSR